MVQPRFVRPTTTFLKYFFSHLLCSLLSLPSRLYSVGADGQTGRSVLSLQDFGSHTIGLRFLGYAQFCLTGKLNKERKEKKKRTHVGEGGTTMRSYFKDVFAFFVHCVLLMQNRSVTIAQVFINVWLKDK